jgi:ABC-type sugar transport system ATPase subunit
MASSALAAVEAAVGPAPLLVTRALTKRFPGVLAVDRCELTIQAGEIVALLGQNGAGKSTLIKILAGVYPAGSYHGEISLDGRPFRPGSVAAAEAAGIALVPQEVNVAPDLSVAETMYLHAEPTRFGLIDWPARHAAAQRALREFALAIDPRTPMGALDLATQQLVIIARALSKKARVLILDEPTAALTDHEAQRLFGHMRSLAARGVACLFVSHRLAEVFAIADRIVVMRDGRMCGAHRADAVSRDTVVGEMVGRVVAGTRRAAAASPGHAAIEVRDLVVRDVDPRRRPWVDGLNFTAGSGEILGLFGLLGAGCGEAAAAIFGAWTGPVTGEVLVGGVAIGIRDPAHAIRGGIGLMAQDRRDTLLLDHSVAENIALASLSALTPFGFLDLAALRRLATDYVARLQIKAPSIDAAVGTLSGGNQQKVQVARWLASGARILLLVDPTRGVDVGARAEINALWRRLAGEGHAIVLVSSESEELVEVCDRVLVLRNGRAVSEHRGDDLSEERLLRAAAGV